MRISRLDILGFKSFVNRMSVSFSEGISAIIGPNGCGKSNIVDAIRWVLGEQSPKQLRGNIMEDMIFAGSESRAPFGVAEVTLTLTNGNGTAPPPFENISEIAITRRLYRSGESEYLINKAPCRLKDIVYLFMDTGVGTKSYSIIDQWQIGNFIDAKPVERRALVEEVAGISKFKYRKEEAVRKIEHTRQNLLRIEDILGEVKRQMNNLHRQAKKANRYVELKKRLRELEIFLASVDYAKWLNILTEKEGAIGAEGEKDKVLEAKIAQLELETERLELESLEQEKILEQQRSGLHDLETVCQDKENRIRHLSQGLEETKRRLTETVQEIERQEKQKNEIAIQKENNAKEVESLNLVWAEKNDRLADAEMHLQELRAEQKTILDELEDRKMEMVDLLSRETHYRNQVRHIDQTLASLTQKRQRNQANAKEALAASETTRQEHMAKAKENEQLEGDINSLHPLISHLRTQEQALTERIQALQAKLREIAQIHTQKTTKIDLLKNLNSNLEGIRAGVKTLLHNHGPKIHGLLADYLETEPGLDLAVEAVLGEKLQSLVVEDVDQALESITYLKTHESGRSGFLTLAEDETTLADEDRLLARWIKVAPPYHNLIRKLLKDVYWFETLAEARSFWKSRSGQCTVVTCDGDIIDRSGFVEGGSREEAPVGFFSRKEEIRRLARDLDELQNEIDETKKNLKYLSLDLTSIQDERKQKEQELAQKKFEHRLKKQELEQLIRTDEIHKKRLAVLEQEVAEFNREDAVLTQELAGVKDALEKMQSEKSSLQAEINIKEDCVVAGENELENSRTSVTDAKMAITALKEKKQYLEAEAVRLHQEYERLKELDQRLHLKMEDIHVQQGKTRKELSETENSLTLVMQEKQEKDQLLRDQLQRNQEQKTLVAQIQAELRSVQKDLKEVQTVLNSLLVAKTEAQLNMQHLKDKIRETYQVSLEEEYSACVNLPFSPDETLTETQEVRENIAKIGEVNLTAIEEYKELEERHNFLSTQYDDLISSIKSLEQAIHKVNRTSRERIHEAIKAINENLSVVFSTLFGGGTADLKLTDPNDPLDSGIELYVQPPGKKLTTLQLLSGGEKALATIALLFAVYLVKPSPFCLLDEVDASLDEANAERFNALLKEIGKKAQIILVTHSQSIMEAADALYGVTMEEKGISKLLSVRLN